MWSRTNPPGHQAGTFSPAANHGRPQAQLIGTLHSAPTATRDQNENSHKMITQWNGVFVETHGRAGTSSPTWYPLTHAVHRLQQPPAAMSKATRRLKQAFEAAVTNKCKLLFTARKQRPFPRASNLSHLQDSKSKWPHRLHRTAVPTLCCSKATKHPRKFTRTTSPHRIYNTRPLAPSPRGQTHMWLDGMCTDK